MHKTFEIQDILLLGRKHLLTTTEDFPPPLHTMPRLSHDSHMIKLWDINFPELLKEDNSVFLCQMSHHLIIINYISVFVK